MNLLLEVIVRKMDMMWQEKLEPWIVLTLDHNLKLDAIFGNIHCHSVDDWLYVWWRRNDVIEWARRSSVNTSQQRSDRAAYEHTLDHMTFITCFKIKIYMFGTIRLSD